MKKQFNQFISRYLGGSEKNLNSTSVTSTSLEVESKNHLNTLVQASRPSPPPQSIPLNFISGLKQINQDLDSLAKVIKAYKLNQIKKVN